MASYAIAEINDPPRTTESGQSEVVSIFSEDPFLFARQILFFFSGGGDANPFGVLHVTLARTILLYSRVHKLGMCRLRLLFRVRRLTGGRTAYD